MLSALFVYFRAKLGYGLLSGQYSKPVADPTEENGPPEPRVRTQSAALELPDNNCIPGICLLKKEGISFTEYHPWLVRNLFCVAFQGDQIGIAPRMFKALVGRGHPEFSTNRQQDAQEFLLHFINMVEVRRKKNLLLLFLHLSHLFVFLKKISLCTEELSLGVQSIRCFQVPGGREDCVSAITESQVHTEGGLHCPASCAHGSGDKHRYWWVSQI